MLRKGIKIFIFAVLCISETYPQILSQCDGSFPYRTSDGSCNNVFFPELGKSHTPFIRYMTPQYGDNQGSMRGENSFQNTNELPTPREVSVAMSSISPSTGSSDISLMVMQWGQFLDHDFTETPRVEVENCCNNGVYSEAEVAANENCRPIDVRNDPFFQGFGVTCLRVTRSEPEFIFGTREQMNELTSYIDGSQIYGSTQEQQNKLRSFINGQLKTDSECENVCTPSNPLIFLPKELRDNEVAFFAGDPRVQEQPGLTAMHTLFLRFHNDIALRLGISHGHHPTFDDELIFQEARRIVIAVLERISYDEFLKEVIGYMTCGSNNEALGEIHPFVYNENLTPAIANVFSTAAFRFGHTLIQNEYKMEDRTIILSESFRNHGITQINGQYPSDFLKAITNDQSATRDHFLVSAVTNKLFAQGPDFSHGSDLYARNIQRGRDHGIPSYVRWYRACGGQNIRTFEDLRFIMPDEVIDAFRQVYRSVDDIDLFPALIAENQIYNYGIVGPTLHCLLGCQFSHLKYGDRFWYENLNQPFPFANQQLDIIRSTTLSAIICMYSSVESIQKSSMKLPSSTNPILNCNEILSNTVPTSLENNF